jgi:hypothetical protein
MSFLINLPGLYGISTMKNNFNLFFATLTCIYFCACTSLHPSVFSLLKEQFRKEKIGANLIDKKRIKEEKGTEKRGR